MPEILMLTPLEDCLKSLKNSVASYAGVKTGNLPDILVETFETGLIKKFEYTYSTAVTTLDKFLKTQGDDPAKFEDMSFKDKLCVAADRNLIIDPQNWIDWRDLRNRTSHLYQHEQLLVIIPKIEAFIADVEFLLQRMRTIYDRS